MENKLPGRRAARSQTVVEFALVMPIMLLLLVGVVETGWLIVNYTQLYNGLREGLRYGASGSCDPNNPQYYNCNGIQQDILAFDPTAAWQLNSSNPITISYDAGDGTTPVGTCQPLTSPHGFVPNVPGGRG